MSTMSQADFARAQGWARSYVTELKRAGRLVMTADGKRVEVELSLQRIEQSRSPDKSGVAERHAAGRAHQSGAAESGNGAADDEDDDEPIARADYQAARARREEANAKRAEIELAEMTGRLLVAEEVEAVIADAVTTFRVVMEGVGAIVAPQVAAESDPAECRHLIDEQVRAALAELADQLSGATRVRASS